MRDIRFRAWHNEAEQYCEGSTSNMFQWLEDGQPVILEQYTGLKDCEGTEIYEGDIVSIGWFDGYGVVERIDSVGWDSDECGFYMQKCYENISDVHRYKVIGNIYENPELLESE